MYGYRQTGENGLMTNLNSISSSLSSLDQVGQRPNARASVDNLIAPRTHSVGSTSLLWRANKQEERHYANTGNGNPYATNSEIYAERQRTKLRRRNSCVSCFDSETALNFLLVPLLLLTIFRQVIDFLGQIWLQILINFFTIIILIVALFGIRQKRISYMVTFIVWSLFNTAWNSIIVCLHTKLREVGLSEEALSFYSGTISWWHANGPGCIPYSISIDSSVLLRPNMITGCRIDYHLIESAQAALHAVLSFLSALVACCALASYKHYSSAYRKQNANTDKSYRLSHLTSERIKNSQDPMRPLPKINGVSGTNSLRRVPGSSQNRLNGSLSHATTSSMRSARRRFRQPVENGTLANRGSTSSTQRPQRYGSLSSRRSNASRRDNRRGDVSSLTYGTSTGYGYANDRNVLQKRQRTRLSSLSSDVDYLPSYRPPHSSNANLLGSTAEVSSIDSYSNQTNVKRTLMQKNRQTGSKHLTESSGNTNPTFSGSKSSLYSHGNQANNYAEVQQNYSSKVVKKHSQKKNETFVAPINVDRQPSYDQGRRQAIYQKTVYGAGSKANGHVTKPPQVPTTDSMILQTYDQTDDLRNQNIINEDFVTSYGNGRQANGITSAGNHAAPSMTTQVGSYGQGEVNGHINKENSHEANGHPSVGVYLNAPMEDRNQKIDFTQSNHNLNNLQHSLHPQQNGSNQTVLAQSNYASDANSETPI